MKYKLELTVNKPRAEVWESFNNPENINRWQTTLVNIENIIGTAGQIGTVSKLTYEEGGRQFSLIEKITYCDEPNRYDVVYENEFSDNPVKNTFIETDKNRTLWIVEVEYRFKTFSMKLLGPVLKKRLILRTQKDMDGFKRFAESPHDV